MLCREIGKAQTILLAALTLLLAMGIGVLTSVAFNMSKMNFSEWDRPQKEADEAAEQVQKGEMPLWFEEN